MTPHTSENTNATPPEHEDLGFALPQPARTSRTRVLIIVAIACGGAFALGWSQRSKAHDRRPAVAAAGAAHATRVEVIKATVIEADHALSLPGTVRALEQTRIYPRVAGYVRRWLVDIGDKVTAGQLLAEIDTPELDAQLAQARAQLAQAEAAVKQVAAQRDYSRSNTQRYETLAGQQLISEAQVEQTRAQASTDEAGVVSAQSNVAAQRANVRRLVETQAFSRVLAPFAGTITARNIERGDLVTEAKTTELYTLVAIDPVRVLIDVPQTLAASIRIGAEAGLAVREYPGRKFAGKITRSAGALDPELRTMTTEVQVANPDGALMPGMYVQVALTFPAPRRVLAIPATALYSDAQGLRVAVVDAQRKAHFVPITIERDTGATLHIATGLTGDEQLVKIAVPGLLEGDPLEIAVTPAPAAGSAAGKPGAPAGSGAPTR
jgi:membrane fusion protein, multidrug efflux system